MVLNHLQEPRDIKITQCKHEVSHFYLNYLLHVAFRAIFEALSYIVFYSATTSTKATQENFLQTSQRGSHIGTMDFHKSNYVCQIYPLSKHNKIQIVAILLFHHSNTIGQFVKKFLGWPWSE